MAEEGNMIHQHISSNSFPKRRVLLEKTIPKYLLIEFGKPTENGRVYLDNFVMPDSMYILDEPPFDTSIPIQRIVGVADIGRTNNGYYADNIRSLRGGLGSDYIKMLHKGDINIHPSGTGTITDNSIVVQYHPLCLYFHW